MKRKKFKKNWFKKARYKFVKKRVLYWNFYYEGLGSSFVSYELKMDCFGRGELHYSDKFNDRYYLLERISKLGFVKGFWEARRIAQKDEDWGFIFKTKKGVKK